MKSDGSEVLYAFEMSLLSRGAWIEMMKSDAPLLSLSLSLLSRGAWIEMALMMSIAFADGGRSSHEERGLKYQTYTKQQIN